MARVPDWLLNLSNSQAGWVEDSPQFRATEQETQLANLNSATDQAVKQLEERRKAAAEAARQTEIANLVGTAQMIQDITPTPTPLQGPDEQFFPELEPMADTPMTPNIPGPSDFAVDLSSAPSAPTEEEDEATEVMKISQATGLDPQVVASMALLGQDIERIEQEKQPPAPAGNADDPRMPQPLMQSPPDLPPAGNLNDPRMVPPPMAAPMATPMAPAGNMDDPRQFYR